MKLTQNTILITGGTSGIGRALAETFHDLGNKVIITGRRQTLLNEITSLRPNISGYCMDVTDSKSIQGLAKTVGQQFPALNVVIANAGISASEDFLADDWNTNQSQEIINTNIMGVVSTIGAFIPHLKTQTSATILATSSALAFVPLASFPTYCASKAFLHSWLVSLRHQLSSVCIEVLEISPPYVQTELTGAHQLSDPRALPINTYIKALLHMLDVKDYANGELILEQDQARRWAERDGTYKAIFSAMNS